jgi:hypothetical protein
MVTRSWSATSSATSSGLASATVPLKRLRPSMSLSVRIETFRPTALRKCAGVRSGRSIPGDETSTV